MVELVKCLLCKYEDLRPHVKKPGVVAMLVILVLGRLREQTLGPAVQTALANC